jgi:hypothetical protein
MSSVELSNILPGILRTLGYTPNPTGERGTSGPQGEKGQQGIQGPPGEPGRPGDPGATTVPGISGLQATLDTKQSLAARLTAIAWNTGVDLLSWASGTFKATFRTTVLTDNREIIIPDRNGTLAFVDQLIGTARINEIAMIGSPQHHTSTANAEAKIDLAASSAGLAYQLNSLVFSYSGRPSTSLGLLTVSNGAGTVYIEQAVTAEGTGPVLAGIKLPANTRLLITLAAGGPGVVGRISASVSTV